MGVTGTGSTTPEQKENLRREIERRKDNARRTLADGLGRLPTASELLNNDEACRILVQTFWETRTRSELLAFESPAVTAEYTLPLPEFQEFVREITRS